MRAVPAAVVLCRFTDVASTPHPKEFYERFFTEAGAGTGGCYDYWSDVTYGAVSFRGSRVFDWIDVGHTIGEVASLTFPGDRARLWQWGADAAAAAGIDLSPFAVLVVVLNSSTDHGSAGGNRVVFGYTGPTWEPTFAFHEIGHAIGLDHSWSARPDVVYGDRWDVMSAMNVWTFTGSYGAPAGPGLAAPYVDRLGALPPSRVWSPSPARSSDAVTLAPLDEPQAPGHLAVRVPARYLGPHQTATYYAEFRRRQGWDRGIPDDTVLVHEVRPDGLSYLLGPALAAGSPPLVVPSGDLTIRCDVIDRQSSSATVTVETTVTPTPPRCAEIASEVSSIGSEIVGLQDELRHAAPADKPYIAAQIRGLRRREAALRKEAGGLGCP